MPTSAADPQSLQLLRDHDWLCDAYVRQGKSRREIAETIGVSHSTVGEWLHRHGITMRGTAEARQAVFDRQRAEELEDRGWLIDAYYGRRLSLADIANEVGVAPSTVRAAMDRLGVPTRTDRLRDRNWLAEQLATVGIRGAAESVGVTTTTVRRWIKTHGLDAG